MNGKIIIGGRLISALKRTWLNLFKKKFNFQQSAIMEKEKDDWNYVMLSKNN